MKKTWIGNGRVVLPDQVLENSSVLLEDGRIAAIGESCPRDAEKVDAKQGNIMAGFIDIHLHGGGNADFMDNTVEDVRQVARAHCTHGTTAMVPTTMTCPDEDLEQFIDCFLEAQAMPQEGAELLGLHLEGPYFSAASKGAQPVTEQRVPDEKTMESIIQRAKGRILRWDAAPELPEMEMFVKVVKRHGIMPAVAHTAMNATRAMQAFDWGFCHVTHFYNAVTTFHKENGLVHAGVVEATYLRDDVTIELIGDGRHIPKESMQLAYRIKGPDRIALITDSMRAACTDDKFSILGARKNGTPVAIKDNVAQLMDFSFYAGSIATMDRCLRVAHLEYGLPLPGVSRMLSLTPARLMKCDDRMGSIQVGKDADLVILSPDFQVQKVYTKGKLFHSVD